MTDLTGISKTKSEPTLANDRLLPDIQKTSVKELSASPPESFGSNCGDKAAEISSSPSMPSPNLLSRNPSVSDVSVDNDDWEVPPETLTVFDLLDNLALPTALEGWQSRLARQTDKVRRQQAKLKSSTTNAKHRVVEEWRRRVPPPEEQLDKYRKRVKESIDRFGNRWSDAKAVTVREKLSFIAGVLNIFISGYWIGSHPESFYYWFSVQLCYFMPIRYYTYRKRGYHYFLADMCYFVNLLLLLSIWVAPQSKRLFISTYCLAYGNNAVAIAMWRNSMVFHSLDKVTSLFIHIMPPVTLHCLVHLTPSTLQELRFPGVYAIRHSHPDSPIHYSLLDMIIWLSVPYAIWQISYHFLITVRRREKIAAGRPTSFTWLRKSYSNSWIGKVILRLPEALHESAFMLVQYVYALATMIPCPIWFWYRWASAAFLTSLFIWSIYNGATYYIDVFGMRFQRELEQMKKDVAKWQTSPNGTFSPQTALKAESTTKSTTQPIAAKKQLEGGYSKSETSIDKISLLDSPTQSASEAEGESSSENRS